MSTDPDSPIDAAVDAATDSPPDPGDLTGRDCAAILATAPDAPSGTAT